MQLSAKMLVWVMQDLEFYPQNQSLDRDYELNPSLGYLAEYSLKIKAIILCKLEPVDKNTRVQTYTTE